MRWLLCIAALSLTGAENLPPDSGLTVHEWGTFTSVAGSDGRPLEWQPLAASGSPQDELPCFVERYAIGAKTILGGTVRMETPVLYFYSPRERTVSVKVDFPQGLITEWYPKASQISPKSLANGLGGREYPAPGRIEWSSVRIQPGAEEKFPIGSLPSHYYQARDTDAAPVLVNGQNEKFLFYRGVGRFKWRGDSARSLAFETGQDRDAAAGKMEAMLIASGLFPVEAKAMVATWRDSWFEDGSRVLYILSGPDVDKFLPLTIDPKPANIRRVFVGRMEIMTDAMVAAAKDAVRRGDMALLAKHGRFLDPVLWRLRQENSAMGPAIDKAYSLVWSNYRGTAQSCGAY